METIDASSLSTISNQDLIMQAVECVDNLELEKAVVLYDEGLRRFPNNTIIMDSYSELLLQLNQP